MVEGAGVEVDFVLLVVAFAEAVVVLAGSSPPTVVASRATPPSTHLALDAILLDPPRVSVGSPARLLSRRTRVPLPAWLASPISALRIDHAHRSG